MPEQAGPRTLEIVEAIRRSECGMTTRDLAAKFSLRMNTVSQHLHIARVLGHILVTRSGGPSPIWYTEGHSAVVRMIEERREARKKALKAKHRRQYKIRAAKKRAAEMFDENPERDSMPIRRSWVDAAKAEPLRPKGPVSVFDLGAQ